MGDPFDNRVLVANHLEFPNSDELVFASSEKFVPTIGPSSSFIPPPPSVSVNDPSLTALFQQVESNTKSLNSINHKLDSILSSFELTRQSLDAMDTKLLLLKAMYSNLSKHVGYEFGALQEGMTSSVKIWEKEFVKLFFMLGTGLSHNNKHQWFDRHWMGDKTLDELTLSLPLPVVPPPAVFGFSREEYKDKIFQWLAARDGKNPSSDFYEIYFTELGQPPVYPDHSTRQGKTKGKGKVSDPVDLD